MAIITVLLEVLVLLWLKKSTGYNHSRITIFKLLPKRLKDWDQKVYPSYGSEQKKNVIIVFKETLFLSFLTFFTFHPFLLPYLPFLLPLSFFFFAFLPFHSFQNCLFLPFLFTPHIFSPSFLASLQSNVSLFISTFLSSSCPSSVFLLFFFFIFLLFVALFLKVEWSISLAHFSFFSHSFLFSK